jgi:hypothetical protein
MFPRATSLQLLFWNTYVAAQSILTLTASLPGNPLNGLAVNADGESFDLGGSPSYYCPTEVEPNCPNTTETIFAPGLGALDVSLAFKSRDFGDTADNSVQVLVPGGQQVYISSDGELGFTQAHSAYVPPGAYFGGWINLTIVSDCAPTYTVLTWKGATTGASHKYICIIFIVANAIQREFLPASKARRHIRSMLTHPPSTTLVALT